MPLPKVAIVGRPNVGKSSLFNALARRRIAIEDPNAGITRDRVSAPAEIGGRTVELIDTGGIGIVDADNLTEDIELQIAIAMEEADLIIFAVDVRDAVTPLDIHVADRLRRLAKPVILVANKADTTKFMNLVGEFSALGLGDALPVSAKGRRNLDILRKRIKDAVRDLPLDDADETPEGIKIAIVGKRNAGKSTLVNYFAGNPRVIVSDVPGTTRDSIDVPFEYDGQKFLAIDTAGIRRKKSVRASVDFFSTHRTERSIRRSDVTILLLDCSEKLSIVDKKLASYIVEEKKPTIVALNKYDLAKHIEPETFQKYMKSQLTGLAFAPMVFMSALTGFNLDGLLKMVCELHKQANFRAGTGEINRIMQEIYRRRRPRVAGSRLPKIYYVTQTGVAPPTIVLFTSNPEAFDVNYLRYVENSFRDALPFAEVPIKVVLRTSGGKEKREDM